MNHTASPQSEFLRGIKECSPMLIGLLPWALILGMQGGQKGMSWLEMLLMTGMNFAGGSEFAAVNLWANPLPIMLIATVTFMINSRHILMGAAIAPYMRDMPLKKAMPALFVMCDESWAMAFAEIQKRKAAGLPAFNMPFYAGVCFILYVTWIGFCGVCAAVGPMFGDVAAWGFGMAFSGGVFGVTARYVEELCGFTPLVCQPDCGVRNLFDRGRRMVCSGRSVYRDCWRRILWGEQK